jgi:hypothetical protein
MTASPGRVHTRIDGPIGWIIFDNPGRHNAMSVAMWEAFPDAVGTLEADPQVRVIVLRGAGDQAFVSGADISQFDEVRDSLEANQRYEAMGNAGMSRLADCTKPTLAMLQGWCLGGGMAITLNCDMRMADESLRYGIPAARLGIGYRWPGIKKLVDTVGAPNARVGHLEALGERRPVDDRRRLQTRHRIRTRLVATSFGTRLRTTPVAVFYALLEILQALLFGRFRHARDISSAWLWNLTHAGSTRQFRARFGAVRRVDDSEVRAFQRRGNVRLSAFIRAQFGRSEGDDSNWDFVSNIRATRGTLTFTAWLLIIAYLLIASRELLFSTIPAVERELMLLKVAAPAENRSAIFDLVQVFRAKVVDVADDALTLEVVGDPGKLVALERLLERFGILEIARTGKVALERASGVNTEWLKATSSEKRVPA